MVVLRHLIDLMLDRLFDPMALGVLKKTLRTERGTSGPCQHFSVGCLENGTQGGGPVPLTKRPLSQGCEMRSSLWEVDIT